MKVECILIFMGSSNKSNKKSKFKIGDTVRVSKYKRKVFDRG